MFHCSEAAAGIQMRGAIALALAATLALAGCETLAPKPAPPAGTSPQPREAAPAKPPSVAEPAKPPPVTETGALRPAAWRDLPEWQADDPAAAWAAFRTSCR